MKMCSDAQKYIGRGDTTNTVFWGGSICGEKKYILDTTQTLLIGEKIELGTPHNIDRITTYLSGIWWVSEGLAGWMDGWPVIAGKITTMWLNLSSRNLPDFQLS